MRNGTDLPLAMQLLEVAERPVTPKDAALVPAEWTQGTQVDRTLDCLRTEGLICYVRPVQTTTPGQASPMVSLTPLGARTLAAMRAQIISGGSATRR